MILNQEDGGRKRLIEGDGVIYQVLSVTRSGRVTDRRPRIQVEGNWLTEMGFVSGVLVQALPEQDGLVFNLCDKNITYSELYNETKEKSGALNRAYISNTRTHRGLTFVTTGQPIHKGGLTFGDALVAKCEYGRIRVRKINGNIRLVNVARMKKPGTGEPTPKVFLLGDWLNNISFTSNTLVTVATEPGCITFTAHDKAVIYSEIVKYARQNKMQLIQVSTKDGSPLINVQGLCATRAGFDLGDIFAAEYENGSIKLKRFDPQRFGFPEV